MNKNATMMSKIGGLGLAGVMAFGASSAMAEEFGASANVSSALAITIVNDMNFGDIFASTASSADVASLAMAPDGTFTTGDRDDGNEVKILSLGGDVQPAQGTVATTNNFTIVLPDHVNTADPAIYDQAGTTEMTIAGGDPGIAKLLVANFTVGVLTSAVELSETVTAAATTGDPREYVINPDFDAVDVGFNIGADIITDDGAGVGGDRVEYEDGVYSGTFTVTAEF
jgi:hypothetical protein